jgi:PPOX class probable FMN-dependent enzyme
MRLDPAHLVSDADALQALYGASGEASIKKEVDHVHPHYRAFIEAAPFAVLATAGPGGLDASPRGDPARFVGVVDEKKLLLPDRRGNNRIDSLRNVLADPRVALLFLVPGVGETLRVNGSARISVDPALLARFDMDGKLPRSVLVVDVHTVYFQCSRALLRSKLWDPQAQVPRSALPSVGRILSDLTAGTFDGATYDRELPARVAGTLY